jgi:saccharopepsin
MVHLDNQGASRGDWLSTPAGHRVPIYSTKSSQYACNISIGTPSVAREVIVDTGIPLILVKEVPCDGNNPHSTCRDVLRIGDLTVQNQLLASAGPDFWIGQDGILGLGYVRPVETNTQSVFYNMFLQGLIEKPLFALYIGNNDSEISFGTPNRMHYHGDMVNLPVRRESYWEAELDTISLGQQTIELDGTGAIFDSGSPRIALPQTLVQIIHKEMGAKSGDHGDFYVDCDRRQSLPDLTFTLAGQNFTLTSTDYIVHAGDNCVSMLIGIDFPSPPGPFALLGVPFLKKWYSVFDLEHDVVGLALAR